MPPMSLSKSELRRRLKSQRQKLSRSDAEKRSSDIVQACIHIIPWQDVKNIHVYTPIKSENEIDTDSLLRFVWKNYPSVQVVVPRLNHEGDYDSVRISSQTKWVTSGVRIPEPIDGEVLSADHRFDVVIVPMLGFDSDGFRLGHGLGWYDRFLATQTQALTIGLCYEFDFVAKGLPREPHDIPPQYIVTEATVRKTPSQHLIQS